MTEGKTNSKKIFIIIGATVALFALVVLLIFQLRPTSSDIYIENQLALPIDNLSYNIQNTLSNGMIGATDKYIYYSNNEGLFRVNKDGSEKIGLDNGYTSNINIYEGNLYYTKRVDSNSTARNANFEHIILKQPVDGLDKTVVARQECQRISSMVVVNDLITCELVVFEATGGLNDFGEPVGNLHTDYKAFSVDGSKNGSIEQDWYQGLRALKYIFNQTELDSLLRDKYPDVSVRDKYVLGNKQYFAIRSMKGPNYSALLSIDKESSEPFLIEKYIPQAPEGVPSNVNITGFTYSESDKILYYIVSERSKESDKMDLYKLDTTTNVPILIGNIL